MGIKIFDIMKLTKGILLIISLLAIGSARAQMSNINEDIANTVILQNSYEEFPVSASIINETQPSVQPSVQNGSASEISGTAAPENTSAYNPSSYENAEIDATKEQIESLQIRIAQMKEEIALLKSKVGSDK